MATRYVWSGATGGGTGADWTNAYITYGAAVTASTAAGDIIKVHKAHAEALSADATYTFAQRVATVVVDKDNSDALATMDGTTGYIGHTSLNRSITIAGAYNLFFYGVCFRTAGATADSISLINTDGQHCFYEACYLWAGNTSTSGRVYIGGVGGSRINGSVTLKNCVFRFGVADNGIDVSSTINLEMLGCSLATNGAIPTSGLFKSSSASHTSAVRMEGCDWSGMGSNYLIANMGNSPFAATLVNCKLGSGAVATTQTVQTRGSIDIYLFNCASGDTHYHLAHYAGNGSTVIETTIVPNDGASPDGGTTRTSWKISGNAGACLCNPYISPWIDKYHSGTSAITPYLEILWNDSTTAFNNNEVWAEFSYQGNSGSTLSSLVWDRVISPAHTAAAQDNGMGLASWSGESGTAWSGKLAATASVTPAEVGDLRARVYVAGNFTVYVDPAIRT